MDPGLRGNNRNSVALGANYFAECRKCPLVFLIAFAEFRGRLLDHEKRSEKERIIASCNPYVSCPDSSTTLRH
jgi:hypothetical protein